MAPKDKSAAGRARREQLKATIRDGADRAKRAKPPAGAPFLPRNHQRETRPGGRWGLR